MKIKWIFFDVGSTLVAKPNRLIFERAFEMARCLPHESVMVGDRLDNDVIPAKSIGMKTVWIRKGLSIYQDLELGENFADWTVENLADLKVIFK